MINPQPHGEIPQSPALAEAEITSLGELFSKDPEGYSKQDLAIIVAHLRSQRERLALGAESGPKPRAKTPGPAATLKSTVGSGDLGL